VYKVHFRYAKNTFELTIPTALSNLTTTALSFVLTPYLRRTHFVEFTTQMKKMLYSILCCSSFLLFDVLLIASYRCFLSLFFFVIGFIHLSTRLLFSHRYSLPFFVIVLLLVIVFTGFLAWFSLLLFLSLSSLLIFVAVFSLFSLHFFVAIPRGLPLYCLSLSSLHSLLSYSHC